MIFFDPHFIFSSIEIRLKYTTECTDKHFTSFNSIVNMLPNNYFLCTILRSLWFRLGMADYIHDTFPDYQVDEEVRKTLHLEDRHTVGQEETSSHNL